MRSEAVRPAPELVLFPLTMKSHPLSVALSVFCALLLLVGGGFGVAAVLPPACFERHP